MFSSSIVILSAAVGDFRPDSHKKQVWRKIHIFKKEKDMCTYLK
jgi:hypothetical protein